MKWIQLFTLITFSCYSITGQVQLNYNLGINQHFVVQPNKNIRSYNKYPFSLLNHELSVERKFSSFNKLTLNGGIGINFFQFTSFYRGLIFDSDFVRMETSFYHERFIFISPSVFSSINRKFGNFNFNFSVICLFNRIIYNTYLIHETASGKNYLTINKNVLDYKFNEFNLGLKLGSNYSPFRNKDFLIGIYYKYNIMPFAIDSDLNEKIFLSTFGLSISKIL